ncbi:transposase family protein [Mycobacterium ulcerans str. Harvey]|uniref:Transposase family protein n=1 Tax=Mycobacterium ulcerans str. Harvey TaxID=1299332 RepID=A0ABN0QWE4_MYCUL|nr:transposase family protein [Mycobacterium ulcerans str. Harvey]
MITATDQRSVEVVYAICSLPFEHARPTAIMTWMRQHWESRTACTGYATSPSTKTVKGHIPETAHRS